MSAQHIPVLKNEILSQLVLPVIENATEPVKILDCTLGGGGHVAATLELLEQHKLTGYQIICFDRDINAINQAQIKFKDEIAQAKVKLIHSRFSNAQNQIQKNQADIILADLGFSSDQLDDPQRGLSFMHSGPLDMRLDPSESDTAFDLLQQISLSDLEMILQEYGEERFTKRIAKRIIEARNQGELPNNTKEFAELIVRSVPPKFRHGRIHAATRTFQAIRIALNEELQELDALLESAILLLKPEGRLGVISFHSGEDRRVKQAFRKVNKKGYQVITKKPITASEDEIKLNSRSRSAKLRILERVNEAKNDKS